MPISLRRLKFIVDKCCRFDPMIKEWDSLNEDERAHMLSVIELQPEELPLAVLLDRPNQIVLSSHRLCWLSDGRTNKIDLNHISEIRPPKDWKFDKLQLHTLIIKTDDSKEYSLEVPPGTTCFSVWNLILSFKGHGFGMKWAYSE